MIKLECLIYKTTWILGVFLHSVSSNGYIILYNGKKIFKHAVHISTAAICHGSKVQAWCVSISHVRVYMAIHETIYCCLAVIAVLHKIM